jgi:hypothetical protein
MGSEINQSVVCDNYNDFQHVNFIFFTKISFHGPEWTRPHDCTAPVGRSVQRMGHISSSSSWNCVNQRWSTVKPFRLRTFDIFCSRYFPDLTLPSHLPTHQPSYLANLLTTLLGLGTCISKPPPPFCPRFAPKQEEKGKRGTSFFRTFGSFSRCKFTQG